MLWMSWGSDPSQASSDETVSSCFLRHLARRRETIRGSLMSTNSIDFALSGRYPVRIHESLRDAGAKTTRRWAMTLTLTKQAVGPQSTTAASPGCFLDDLVAGLSSMPPADAPSKPRSHGSGPKAAWFGALGPWLLPVALMGAFEDVVRLVLPQLQRRGLYRTEYRAATLRDNLDLARPSVGVWRERPALSSKEQAA